MKNAHYIFDAAAITHGFITHTDADPKGEGLAFSVSPLSTDRTLVVVTGEDERVATWAARVGAPQETVADVAQSQAKRAERAGLDTILADLEKRRLSVQGRRDELVAEGH